MSSSDCRNWSVSDMPGNNWKNIGPLANIPVRGSRRWLCLKQKGRPVAVFPAQARMRFSPWIDECPHKKGPLSEGIISGNTVTCPLHNWVIGLEDGKALAPDEGSYPIHRRAGN